MDYAVRNPAYGPNSIINCEIEHPDLGWMPCALDNNLPEHQTMYAAAVAMTPTAYVPPSASELLEAQRAVAVLSRSQFIQAVYVAGILTKAEALASAAGAVPAFFEIALAALVANGDITQQEADLSEILWAGLVQVERNHPLLPVAQAALDLTDAEVDALFGIS